MFRLREIVSGLQTSPFVLDDLAADEAALPVVLAEPPSEKGDVLPTAPGVTRRVRAAVAHAPRGRRVRSAQPREQTALQGSIPAGPVVVSRAVLAQKHADKKQEAPEPRPAAGTLGSMIRALGLDGARS